MMRLMNGRLRLAPVRTITTSAEQTVAGVPATTFDIIMSPTQIKAAGLTECSRSCRRLMSTRVFRALASRTRC